MAKRSIHYQIGEWMRDRLASIRGGTEAGTGFASTPSAVELVGGFPKDPIADYFQDGLDEVILIDSGPELETQKTSGDLDFTTDFYVVAARRFSPPTENPFTGWANVVGASPWANGALALATQPSSPTRLRVRLKDLDGSVTGGTVALVGVDQDGSPLTATFDVAAGKDQRFPQAPNLGLVFASLTSATVAGALGGGAGDVVEVLAMPTRREVQDALARDVIRSLSALEPRAQQLCNQVPGAYNIRATDIDRDLVMDGWAVVQLVFTIDYRAYLVVP